MQAQEDHGTHNHLATFVILKPGLLRKISIRLVLLTLNLIYRTWFTDITPGKLSGLPTIHFAHWTIVPLLDAKRNRTGREALMFLSNYDGSWDAYLDDFLSFLGPGAIAIWANAVGFPARFDGARFKMYARMHMVRHHGWYQAEPTLTVGNVLNNDQIRLGLLRLPRTGEEARLWLSRFGSQKEGHEHIAGDPNVLQTSDIQGVVLRGYRNLEHSAYLPIRFGDDLAATRDWLANLLPFITDARHRAREERTREVRALHLAFTWSGLERLGLDRAALQQFPLPFREGMVSRAHRSRALGDVGDSSPDKWYWGSEARPVDAILMLFAKAGKDESNAPLQQMISEHRDRLSRAGGCVVGTEFAITGSFLPPPDKSGPFSHLPAEHFGFVDGVSQPQIDQSWHVGEERSSRPSPADLLRPGEFVLGYPAEDGARTPGIPLSPIRDRLGLLPLTANGSGYVRDFGRNGSYLVVRQLQQHVGRFRAYTERAAAAAGGPTASVDAVAARMVGRFPNGTPLRSTPQPSSNQFGFADDPHGFECPIGAHIRRANPRDSLGADPAAASNATKRRRLLRRGRTYGAALPVGAVDSDGDDRGLMFMCLNGDIERQFEFVQQNWINGTAFNGLYDESDPIIGRPSSDLMTVQANALRERLTHLERFVTVRGGQYFFLPGLGALRYLAHLEEQDPSGVAHSALTQSARALTPPPRRTVPVLAGVLARVQRWLPTAQLAWAIRYPLLLAALLLLFPLSIRTLPTIAPSLFLTGWWGVAALTFVASLAASVAMITVRLVLMYGQRIGLPRPGWQTASTGRAAAFQLLALPIVGTCIHLSASDADSPYWREVLWLSGPAALGWAAGLAVHSIRRLRPPKNGRLARFLQRISRAAIDQIPEELGTGYIDYRQRRILPGHVFAASLAAIVIAAYAVGYFVLHPAGSARAEGLPSVLYVLVPGFLTIWVLSAFAFFLDRYRVPTLLVLIAWVVIVGSVFRTDHVFAVGDPLDAGATPGEILSRTANDTVVVVMADGLGLVSSAWTSRVLTGLADWPNTRANVHRQAASGERQFGSDARRILLCDRIRHRRFPRQPLRLDQPTSPHEKFGRGWLGIRLPRFHADVFALPGAPLRGPRLGDGASLGTSVR